MDILVSSTEETVMSLRGMVDVALGTPEVGSVNFNMLHTLLHALISKLDLDNAVITVPTENEKPQDGTTPLKIISMTTTPYHLLQDRLKIIEKQISDLNSLPSNKEILDKIFGNAKINENSRLASDLWQSLNMRKKVDCNEEGIDRLSSLIDNILGEMRQLRSDNEAMKKKIEDMESLKGVDEKVNGLQNDLTNLIAEFNKLKDKLSEYPIPEFFKNVVTWEGLEKALRGIKDEMDELRKPTEKIVINMATEDEIDSIKEVEKPDVEVEEKVVEKLDVEVKEKSVELKVKEKIVPEPVKKEAKTYEAYLEWLKDGCHLKLPLPVDDVVNEVNRLIETEQISPNITEGKDEIIFNLKIPLKDGKSKDKSDRKLTWKLIPKSVKTKKKVKYDDEVEINIPLTKWQLFQAGIKSVPNFEVIDGIDFFVVDIPIENENILKMHVIPTETMSRPESSIGSGPSEACADMLEKLGNLTDAHYLLDKRVVVLEEEMPNKADKKDLENLKFPDDLLKTINQLKSQVESLMSTKNRDAPVVMNMDTEALARIRDILNGLQEKMKAVNETVDKLSNENKDLLKQIEELFSITSDHESRKADIGYLEGQLRLKADKSLLDTKVNFSLFDETTGNLQNLINDVLRKLLAAEDELRNLLKSMASDLNGKVDRDDLNALKEWIEKRLRALADKFKNLRGYEANDDEAAGLRKQLLQHFHCISCDRPVDMIPQGLSYGNGLPDPKGLPPTKSLRPYTTYELEAIRQQARGNKNIFVQNHTKRYGSDIIDVYQTPRPCGGSHTTTYSHKKVVRLGNINNSNFDEEIIPKTNKEELDLQGVDGHIYKGRLDRSQTTITNNNMYNEQNYPDRLPPVPMTQRSQSILNNSNLTPRGGFITSRPKSAVKLTARPATGCGNSRPESARIPAQEPDSRPTTPIRNNSQDFNKIEQEIIDVDDAVLTSDTFELEMINGDCNGQPKDESIQS